jgi:hypothetical protein
MQFLRFGVVGAIGFLIDTATVYAVRGSLGLYGAGLAGYVTAATGNWLLNRVWTFRGRGYGPAHRLCTFGDDYRHGGSAARDCHRGGRSGGDVRQFRSLAPTGI